MKQEKGMKQIVKRILTFALTLCMVLSLMPVTTYASEKDQNSELAVGNYLVNLKEIQADGTQALSYQDMNINPRVILTVNSGGKYSIRAKIHGYDQWSTLEVFDQTKYSEVETVKPGTNWTGYDSMPMDRYATQAAKQGDENQNAYWTQIKNPQRLIIIFIQES